MAHQLLSEIHDKSKSWSVSVLVSRMWIYRGGTDHGPIVHMDLVVLDAQGNHMYVQIPAQVAEHLQHEIQEGKVYMLTKFLVNESKPTFRAVESPFMIQFTRYSNAVLRPALEVDYPFCTYNLLPFEDIPSPSGPPPRFIDVIGRITAVSDVVPIVSMHQPEPSNTRTILLVNLQGQELKLVLWGNQALEFEEEAVHARKEQAAVIAIFVGTLPKMNQGTKGLSGSSACRWYIDEDLPVITDFCKRLGTDFKPIDATGTSNVGALPARVYNDPTEMNVSELLRLDPFENEAKRFICTATVQRLNSSQRWWFFSCSACNKISTLIGHQFRCSKPTCSAIKAHPTYCVSLFASDEAAEAEFMLFDKVGKEVVGKPLFTLLKFRNPGHTTIEEIARVPMVDRIAPPEVTRIVGQKYKILVSISKRSFAASSEQLSFQVVRIMESFKPELSSSAFVCAPATPGPSSSTLSPDTLALPGMFTPKTPTFHQAQPACSSEMLSLGYSTPKSEVHTPTSKITVGLLATASPGKSPCPSTITRRALFQNTSPKTTLPKEPKGSGEAKVACDHQPEPSSIVAEEKNDKDDPTQQTKYKRSANAGKGNSTPKKTRQ